jgi:phosphoribosyl 1,2-cyclic phosphodiesterase/ActR/RegA family two-component response regulator
MTSENMRFHVVDDNPDDAALIAKLLTDRGYAVTIDNSGVEALARTFDKTPDCVIIDLMMPGVDGLEVCRRMRARRAYATAKIIIVSGKPYEYDRKRAMEFGADGFIPKPIQHPAFINHVERILSDMMEMAFWGVRGTLPVPGKSSLRYGGNTACVSLEFPRGQFFIFDAGTGIKQLADSLKAQNRLSRMQAKIFISHPHWDHINALPFFTPLYIGGNEFEILGASHGDVSMRQLISSQMDGVYFPINIKEFASRVYFHDISEESIIVDGVSVRSKLLSHPGKCLGYRVDYNGRSVCYVTDNELYPASSKFHNAYYRSRLADFVAGADILITDACYSDEEYPAKIGWGHSSVSEVANFAAEAKVKNLYLFHHDPDQSDEDIDAKLAKAREILANLGSKTLCHAPAEGDTVMI